MEYLHVKSCKQKKTTQKPKHEKRIKENSSRFSENRKQLHGLRTNNKEYLMLFPERKGTGDKLIPPITDGRLRKLKKKMYFRVLILHFADPNIKICDFVDIEVTI